LMAAAAYNLKKLMMHKREGLRNRHVCNSQIFGGCSTFFC
jgi:hypothetical protein